jgi:TP901 family phage tail tape measure protein
MAAINLDIGGNTRRLDRDIQKTVNRVYTINLKTKGDQPLGRITGQVNEFNKSLDASNARVIAFGASAGIIFGVQRAFSALVGATIEVQKSLQDINVILNVSAQSLQKFGGELFNIAKNTGQSFQEVAKAATEFSRQGLGVEETLKRTNEALILSRLSGLDAAKSVEALTAAVNSYASQAVTASEVVNKFANVDAAFAVSSSDLAEALQRVGSSAAQSGVSLNELIAIVTSAQQTTARGGAVIGNSFKTIFTRLQRGKVIDLLESLGISSTDSSGQVKSTIQLLQDLGKVYDTLGSQQQSYVAEQVGGVFQINILKAALADLGKEYSIYSSALNVAAGSTDQAIRRNEELNKTYASQINVLKQNATQLAATAGERLLGPAFERVVGGGNDILGGINESDGTGIGASLGKGIMDGLGQFIAGPGLVIFGGVLLKLLRDLGKFATGSIQQLLGLNTAATQQKDIQTSITQILAKNPQLLELALKGELGLNTAANSLLVSLQKQTVELQKQATVAQQISRAFVSQAGVRVSGGVPVVPTGRTGKAAGYIPNFAQGDFAREELLAASLGAKNPTAQLSKGTIDGKKFIKNNREVEITGFGKNGDSAVIPNYAKGFIPNFAKTNISKTTDFGGKYAYLVPYGLGGGNLPPKKIGKYNIDGIPIKSPQKVDVKKDADKDSLNLYKNIKNLIVDEAFKYTNTIRPLNTGVSIDSIKSRFETTAGAAGALKGAAGAAFEVGMISALDYQSASRRGDVAGNFDVRGGANLKKIQDLFDLRSTVGLADFKVNADPGNIKKFYDKVSKEEKAGVFDDREQTRNINRDAEVEVARELTKDKNLEKWVISGNKISAKAPDFVKKMVEERKNLIRPRYNLASFPKGPIRAAGYIPNFAAIQDAVSRERAAGIPSSQIYLAQEQALTSANPMGLGVFNKQDEPTKGSRKDAMRRKGFARGYIPNFAEDSTSVSSGVAALGIELIGLSYLLSGSRQRYKESFDSMTNANKATKRFAAGADAYGSAIAIGAPILAATIKNAISQTTKTGRGAAAAVTGVGQIASMGATGAQLGLAFGPQGAAVGAALGATAGALLSANDIINGFTSTLPDAQNAYEKASQELTKFNDATALLTKASEDLSNALLETVPNPEKVKKAQDAYANALGGLTEEDRKRIADQKGDKAQQQEQEKIRSEKIAAEKNAGRAVQVSQLYEQSSSIGGEGSRLFLKSGSAAEKSRAEARRDTLKQSFTGMALQGKQGSDALPVLQKLSEKGGISDQLMKLGGIDTATGEFTPDKRPLKERTTELKNILETALPESEFKKGFIADVVTTASTGILNFQGSILTLAEGIREATYSTNKNVESSNTYAQSKTDEAKAVADSIKASQNTINAIQQSIRAAQQQATTERALAQMRAQFATTTSYQEKLRSSETAKALVGENAPLTETFTNRAEIENINKTFQDGLDSLTYGIAGDLSNEISDAFKGSVGKTAGTAVGKEGASAEDIQKATAEADVKSNEQIQAFKNLQQILSANIEGNNKLDFNSLKSVFEEKLTEIGIVGEEQNKITSQLESSVLSGNSEIAKLQEKARQSILELSKEATQKILISKITQAQKFAGGIEEYINPPKPGESTFDKAVTATEGFNQFQGQKANFAFDYKKGTNQFRYQGAAAEDERKKQMPEYGRQSLELIGGLQNYFGYTPDESGKAYQAGVSGLKETLDQQVKKFQDIAADSKTPDIVRDEITKGLKEVSALGGTGNIAAIQVAKQTGSLTEEGYKKITGKFNDPVLETLRQQNPELASMKAAEMIVSDDPTVKAINKTNSILTDIRNGSNGSNSSMGNATQKAIQDAVKTSPVSPTAISTTVPKEITAKDSMGNTVRGKEAETVIARDKKRFEDWSKAGGMGLGPTQHNLNELEEGRYGNLRTSENQFLNASQNDMLDPVLASTKAYRVGLSSYQRMQDEKYGIQDLLEDPTITKEELGAEEGDRGVRWTKRAVKDYASNNPFSPITYDNAMERAGEPIQRSNQNINQQPAAAAQQSFTQQEAIFNNNSSALTTLAGGIESLNSTIANLGVANLNNIPAQTNAGTQPVAGAQQAANQSSNIGPFNVVVNSSEGDISLQLTTALEKLKSEILSLVNVKVAPTVPSSQYSPSTFSNG